MALMRSSIRSPMSSLADFGFSVFSGLRGHRPSVDRQLVDVLVLDVLEVLLAEVVHRDALG